MLEQYEEQLTADEIEEKESELLKQRLAILQQKIREHRIPVIILFEGWSASGKGSMISKLILNMDPRWFTVHNIRKAAKEEKRYPFMHRFWSKIPAYGNIGIFDRSWYQEISVAADGELPEKKLQARLQEIRNFEAQLCNDGYVILKFFLHITKKEQKKRLKMLEENELTQWRVTDNDWKQNKHYHETYALFDAMLTGTDDPHASWHVIPAFDRRYTAIQIYRIVIEHLEQAVEQKESRKIQPMVPLQGTEKIQCLPSPTLKEVELADKYLTQDTYLKALTAGQKRLSELHNAIYLKKIPVILAYEGWDAAGKGGNIKRIARALDPRGYEVIPIGAPTETERDHQYLWRFWNHLPKTGHIAVFDRTWYGRVLVERIEGFCSQYEWERAYEEINCFERDLTEWGAVVLKFWLQIDKEEQLSRFHDRQNTPEKQWKITQEDWRNRERWHDYETAVDEMLQQTNTKHAPWIIVESNDKKYARIKTLEAIIKAIEKRI